MRLPSVLFVGPVKTGTTWIHRYLGTREDVELPIKTKELFFFDANYHRGLSWYQSHFSDAAQRTCPLLVEIAPTLFQNADAPNRVRSTLGCIKIIATTRDPVARSWSHYVHLRRKGITKKPLRDAAGDYPQIINASRYDLHLQRWYSEFGRSNVRVLRLEELDDDPQRYVNALCELLTLPSRPLHASLFEPENAAAEPPSFLLAKSGRILAQKLRSSGLHDMVNLAKRSALYQIFFGSPVSKNNSLRPSNEDLVWLKSQLT